MAKFLITGAAGFIGSKLATNLHDIGHRVIGVDNLSTGSTKNLSSIMNKPNFRFLNMDVCDMTDPNDSDLRLRGVDYVMHFASLASPEDFSEYPIHILDTNLIGTRNMLEIARTHKARFTFASSSEVYGNTEVIPIPETYNGNSNIIGVRGCYDEGKRGGEAYCIAYMKEYGVDVRICRIFNTYGENMPDDGRAIPNLMKAINGGSYFRIYGTGTQTRAFLYIDDLVEGILRQTFMEGLSGIPINLGATEETSIQKLVAIVAQLSQEWIHVTNAPLPEDDPLRRLPDISRAKTLLDWEPTIDLEEGLRRTIDEWN